MTARNPKNRQKQKSPIQRRREFLKLEQAQLANRAGVATMTIQRVEAGLIPNVPLQVYVALYGENNSFSYDECNAEMEEWKSSTRQANVEYLRSAVADGSWRGWLQFRESISESKAGFCKLFCIHPQVLDNFEKPHLVGVRYSLSDYLEKVFRDAGLTSVEIENINSRLYYYIEGSKLTNSG